MLAQQSYDGDCAIASTWPRGGPEVEGLTYSTYLKSLLEVSRSSGKELLDPRNCTDDTCLDSALDFEHFGNFDERGFSFGHADSWECTTGMGSFG